MDTRARAATGLLPFLVWRAPAGIVLVYLVHLFLSATVTVILHEPFAGMAPPVCVTLEPPQIALTWPPQVVVAPPAMTIPLGNRSFNGAVRLALEDALLLKLMVSVVVPPVFIVVALKRFGEGRRLAGGLCRVHR